MGDSGIIVVMLETLVCLGLGTAALKIANSIKQSRMAKRALNSSRCNVENKFPDHSRRDVYKMTVFLTPEEVTVLDNGPVGSFLEDRTINDKEATAVLLKRENK